jgi:hypothetical protein
VNTDQQNHWRTLYKAALLELDPAKLGERIEQAYTAIQACLNAHQNGNDAQHQALTDALANLRVLRREIASPSDGARAVNTPAPNRITPP